MRSTTTVYFLAALLMITGCTRNKDTSVATSPSRESQAPTDPDPVVSGELIVVTQDANAVVDLKKQFNLVEADSKSGVYLARQKQGGTLISGREKEITESLAKDSRLEIVEPNYIVRLQDIQPERAPPRDPKWLSLWALKNYGQDAPNGVEGVKGADISVLQAWNKSQGSKDIIVAVVDTGIDYEHPDLKDNMYVNEKEKREVGVPGVDDDGNGYTDDVYGWNFVSASQTQLYYGKLGSPDPKDDHGHGTHVAGTIGATGNNGKGVVGINWNVRIMALKFLSAQGSGSSLDEFLALKYAAENGVNIINASFGGGSPSKLVRDKAMPLLLKAGVLFVAAAGNESADNDITDAFPANYDFPNVLSVAATDNRDQLAYFSSFGYGKVHLAAPGVAITSTYPVDLALKDDTDKEPYRTWSGTSMATPHVAGAAALVLSVRPELKKQPDKLKEVLIHSVDWLPQLAGKVRSGGRLNLARAVYGEVNPTPTGDWTEKAVSLQTPANPQELIDQAWSLREPGAKAIQAHVAFAQIDTQYDLGMIYDQFYRPIVSLRDEMIDEWLPVAQGDTLHVKFSNGLISVMKSLGVQKVADPERIPVDQTYVCEGSAGAYECMIWDKPTSPTPNITSMGISIDRIRFLK